MDTILIVGMNGAIGKAVNTVFSKNGMRCIGTSSRHPKQDTTNMIYLDLEDHDSILAAQKHLPMLNGIVFCAGLAPHHSLKDTTVAHHAKMMSIHVNGPLFTIQCLLKKMKKGSSIIFISSVAAYKGSYDPSYSIAKAAVSGMTKTLARELSAASIRVNAIAPGLVSGTPVHKKMTPDFKERHLRDILTKEFCTTKDCAEAIYFLYTQKQITGQVLHINGGQYFGN